MGSSWRCSRATKEEVEAEMSCSSRCLPWGTPGLWWPGMPQDEIPWVPWDEIPGVPRAKGGSRVPVQGLQEEGKWQHCTLSSEIAKSKQALPRCKGTVVSPSPCIAFIRFLISRALGGPGRAVVAACGAQACPCPNPGPAEPPACASVPLL